MQMSKEKTEQTKAQEDERKIQAAWDQHHTEEWMLGFNMITGEYLQKVRMIILVVFSSVRQVDVSYNPETFIMVWTLYFKRLQPFFKKRKGVVLFLERKLTERFPDCRVTVQEGK